LPERRHWEDLVSPAAMDLNLRRRPVPEPWRDLHRRSPGDSMYTASASAASFQADPLLRRSEQRGAGAATEAIRDARTSIPPVDGLREGLGLGPLSTLGLHSRSLPRPIPVLTSMHVEDHLSGGLSVGSMSATSSLRPSAFSRIRSPSPGYMPISGSLLASDLRVSTPELRRGLFRHHTLTLNSVF
jgi:hypothetical protein